MTGRQKLHLPLLLAACLAFASCDQAASSDGQARPAPAQQGDTSDAKAAAATIRQQAADSEVLDSVKAGTGAAVEAAGDAVGSAASRVADRREAREAERAARPARDVNINIAGREGKGDGAAPETAAEAKAGDDDGIGQNWLLLAIVGGAALVGIGAFVGRSRKEREDARIAAAVAAELATRAAAEAAAAAKPAPVVPPAPAAPPAQTDTPPAKPVVGPPDA